jgi:hypothetical protein
MLISQCPIWLVATIRVNWINGLVAYTDHIDLVVLVLLYLII